MKPKKRKEGDVRRKIMTVSEIAKAIGPFPRKKTVVMCHGTFDIVHPGHLRHLMYAKERGDYLIASLTADKHVEKANHRPYVPQDLRALNLAALEFVDFVIIDENDVPLENIRALKPDFFAKGFDYVQAGVPPKTQAEIQALEEYGGEIIFTPGDVVYSSSALIESAPPKIGIAKLLILMQSEKVEFSDLRLALKKLKTVDSHVVGDTIIDTYIYCRTSGSNTKTPTLSVQQEREVNFSGGAAIVAKHLKAAGGNVRFSTILGEDELNSFVVKDLEAAGVEVDAITDRTRPTTRKTTYICQGYHVLRVGKIDNRIISMKIRDHICGQLKASKADAFIFSDFRHGIFSRSTIPNLISALPEGSFRVADSQVASRWGNILEFQGFDLITPNEREARFTLGDQDSVVRPLARELYQRAKCRYLILKMGERGQMTYCANSDDSRAFFTVDSFCEHVVDAVGAGDALLAYSTLTLKATGSIIMASILGAFAAAVACEHEGNSPVTPEQIEDKINSVENVVQFKLDTIEKVVQLK